jgi:hypothetical protein
LIAFLGRYGKQPVNAVMKMEKRDAQALAEAVGELMEQEGVKGGG